VFGIGFGELDAIVRVMHGVSPDNAALIARFKYMQRLGFPEGVNSGRGVRSVYGIEETLKVLLAFELLETGATPTRVIRMIRTGWIDLRQALALGWFAARHEEVRSQRLMLCAMPGAFRELGQEEDPQAKVAEPLRSMDLNQLVSWMTAADQEIPNAAEQVRASNGPRRLVIDPMRLAAALRALVPELTAMEAEDLDAAFADFGSEAFNGAPEEAWSDLARSRASTLGK
jgi:hypothetical protein